MAVLATSCDKQESQVCSDTYRTDAAKGTSSKGETGYLITNEMIACTRRSNYAPSNPDVPADSVEVMLVFGRETAPGVVEPSPLRLIVPLAYLDPLNPTAVVKGGRLEASAVGLFLPKETLPVMGFDDFMPIVVAITADGWQERARELTDPRVGKDPNFFVGRESKDGLYPILLTDLSKFDSPQERRYLTEDPDLGFVRVKCIGFLNRDSSCVVSTQTRQNIELRVRMPEKELGAWRQRVLVGWEVVDKLVISSN
jgi:hypothetical protein